MLDGCKMRGAAKYLSPIEQLVRHGDMGLSFGSSWLTSPQTPSIGGSLAAIMLLILFCHAWPVICLKQQTHQCAYDFVKSPVNMLSMSTFSINTSLVPCTSHTSWVSVLISTISPPASSWSPGTETTVACTMFHKTPKAKVTESAGSAKVEAYLCAAAIQSSGCTRSFDDRE